MSETLVSASFFWSPREARRIECAVPSVLTETLKKAFGGSENKWELCAIDVPVLKGIAAAGGEELSRVMGELIYNIEVHDTIRVWAEW